MLRAIHIPVIYPLSLCHRSLNVGQDECKYGHTIIYDHYRLLLERRTAVHRELFFLQSQLVIPSISNLKTGGWRGPLEIKSDEPAYYINWNGKFS